MKKAMTELEELEELVRKVNRKLAMAPIDLRLHVKQASWRNRYNLYSVSAGKIKKGREYSRKNKGVNTLVLFLENISDVLTFMGY